MWLRVPANVQYKEAMQWRYTATLYARVWRVFLDKNHVKPEALAGGQGEHKY
jgi:hypothetical protein